MSESDGPHILLQGIVGSTAYGLNAPASDIDRLGIYQAPNDLFLGLRAPAQDRLSIVRTNPDVTLHEVAKFLHLATKANPSITELLWLTDYEHITPANAESMQELQHNRRRLLCARAVRDAYFGYATAQFHRLWRSDDNTFGSDLRKRTAKHARHILRLLQQGFELYDTGTLTVRVENPQQIHDFGAMVAEGGVETTDAVKEVLHQFDLRFSAATPALAETPDHAWAQAWLLHLRHANPEARV